MKPLKPAAKPQGAAPAEARHLLVYVEDDDANWRVALAGLSQEYHLLRAKNSAEACQLFREHANEIYAILMDIELQGSDLNGLQLARLLRGQVAENQIPIYARNMPSTTAPVLFVTAYGKNFPAEEFKAAGSARIISKPVNFVELSRALTQIHLERVTSSVSRLTGRDPKK